MKTMEIKFRAWLGTDVPGITKIISWMLLFDALLLLGALLVHEWWAYVAIMPIIYVGSGYANKALAVEGNTVTVLVALLVIMLASLAFGESLGFIWLVPAFLAVILGAAVIVVTTVILLVIAITCVKFLFIYVEMFVTKWRENRQIKADVLS